MTTKRVVLSDHKRVGARFLPPFTQAVPLSEVSYSRNVLPEAVWIAVLTKVLGPKYELATALDISRAATVVRPLEHFGFCAGFGALSKSEKGHCLAHVRNRNHASVGLAPLVSLYPECPLEFICESSDLSKRDKEADLKLIEDILGEVIDKTTKEATLMQAGVIYVLVLTNKLQIVEGTGLEQIPELESYPNTELSRVVAATVRATMNALGGDMMPLDKTWQRYFWNRGLELSPCEVWR